MRLIELAKVNRRGRQAINLLVGNELRRKRIRRIAWAREKDIRPRRVVAAIDVGHRGRRRMRIALQQDRSLDSGKAAIADIDLRNRDAVRPRIADRTRESRPRELVAIRRRNAVQVAENQFAGRAQHIQRAVRKRVVGRGQYRGDLRCCAARCVLNRCINREVRR